ncbi:hypothetical protein LUZ61_008852 [Rhynchospora tenuis]|uniref:non-specific serine/threonine protein kinase n=1 Tax=Rhynchospora tenuis TaxID=198213 RepID=A0AAD6EXT6_9POAL|nr:hypothetical protein LUZ61_008852 [Rhynchospora tenuis]
MTQDLVKFFVSSGDNGAYFWYEPQDLSVLWRLVLKSNGTTYRYKLNGSDWIEYWKAPDESTPSYAICGPYGIYVDGDCKCCVETLFHPKNGNDWKNRIFSEGCERNVPLNDTYNGFVALRNVKLPDTINAVSAGNGSTGSDCETWCMKNSSCVAYAYIEWQGCLAWFGDIIDMEQFLDEGATLYIRVASKRVVEMYPYVQVFEIFDYNTIRDATDNFSDSNIVGHGQMGPVYKGVLENRQVIAVKKLTRSVQNGNEQLRNELYLLAILKHKNLVRLMGFCIQQQEIILCFEFMRNGSLDKMLFDARLLEEGLNWEQRHGLITKIASGLLYLHDENGDTIIHRDIKPGNILLDENMNPRIADFGIARLFEGDRSTFTASTDGAGTMH